MPTPTSTDSPSHCPRCDAPLDSESCFTCGREIESNIEDDPVAVMPPERLASYQTNFDTLQRAADDGNLVMVTTIRKSDRATVALVCGVQAGPNNTLELVPFAVMCEGNPYDDFEIPFEHEQPTSS